MKIARLSPLTGKISVMDLPVTPEQMAEFNTKPRARLVQDIFPELSADEREFIKSGYTADDWAAIFPPEDDDDES